MNANGSALKIINTISHQVTMVFMVTAFVLCSSYTHAGNLNISDDVLELTSGVEPNIVIFNDDSGSMDHGVMVTNGLGAGEGDITWNKLTYKYVFPDPGVTTTLAPAANIKDNGSATTKDLGVVPTEAGLLDNGYTLAQTEGVWRAWSYSYSSIYYNPFLTYEPWNGRDINGNLYSNVSPSCAPYNPYDPSLGCLDLISEVDYITRVDDSADLDGDLVYEEDLKITGLFPARFNFWVDSDGDGLVDADDTNYKYEYRNGGCDSGVVCSASLGYMYPTTYNSNPRTDCSNVTSTTSWCTVAEDQQNFANWFSYYRKRDLTAKAALSNAIEDATLARIGYATLNNNSNVNIPVASMNTSSATGNKKDLMDKLFSTEPTGGTPMREGYEKLGKYFECASGDLYGSTASSTPGSTGCPIEATPRGTCQRNFAVIMTDGYYNGSAPTIAEEDQSPGTTDTEFDGGAFASASSNTLADVAMYYYERDLHSTLSDDVPTTSIDVNRYAGSGSLTLNDTLHQHVNSYALALGVKGTLNAMPNDPVTAFTWPDPTVGNNEKIDDLRHAAYNGRGLFTSAADSEQLSETLETVFDEFGAGQGSAASVAFNTQTIQSNSVVYRSFFNTQTNTGDLVAQRINSNGQLNIDANGNDIYEWSAASMMDQKRSASGDSRVIITYEENGSSSQGVPFRWSGADSITSTQQGQLNAPQPGNITLPTTVGEERLNYLRGHSVDEGYSFDDGEFRVRPTTAGKLGDFVNSNPVYVGKPPFIGRNTATFPGEYPSNVADLYNTFKNDNETRTPVVYIGSNDGMLHAFDANTGEEIFAYVPNTIFSELTDLTDPNYSHQFYVDLTPSINDIFMTKSGDSSASWNSVLVGGLRAGGKGLYALNITDPTTFNTESNAAANVMWEFTEADDGTVGNSDLGLTFSAPLIAMSNELDANGEQKWVAIFGNGYNSTSSDGDAAIYILFIEAGQDGVWTSGSDYIKISTGYGKAESSDGTTPNGIGAVRGIDVDDDGTVDRLYAGDLQGNLYRVDISSTSSSDWTNSSNRDVIFKARYGTSYPRSVIQPITTRPVVVDHPDEPGYIIVFATGSWMTSDDAVDTNIQSVYGIWDNNSGGEVLAIDADNQLQQQVFTNHVNQEHGFVVRSLTNNSVAWRDNGSASNKVMGWYIDFDIPAAGSSSGIEYPGERAVRNLQVRGEFIFMNTIFPKSVNPCLSGAGGFELAFNPVTGGSGSSIVFDINADGEFDTADNINDTIGDTNIVSGIRFESGTPTDAAFIGNYRITQTSSKDVRSVGTNTVEANQSGRTSWMELIAQ